MKRRQALLLASSGLAVSGCLGFGQRQQAQLSYIWLVNDREETYEVEVVVADNEQAVFTKSFELGTEPGSSNIDVENPVDGAGDYVVRATMDGETREVATTDVIDEDEPCVGVQFVLLNNGSVDYSAESLQQC